MNEPHKRPFIKKRCRYYEHMICKSRTDRKEVEETITEMFADHLGKDGESSSLRFKFNDVSCAIKWDTYGLDLYVAYYRGIEWTAKKNKEKDKIYSYGEIFKRVNLANFIFRECNPLGLEILEKSTFMII